jgi:4-hydroxy-2-oxoglutarate aldolase
MLHAVPTLYSGTTGIPALLQQGAVGIASPIAAACPYACITIFEAILKREVDAAQDWQNRLLRFANLLDTHQLPALKYALDYNGFYGGPPRLPHLSVARAIQEQIEDALHGLRG